MTRHGIGLGIALGLSMTFGGCDVEDTDWRDQGVDQLDAIEEAQADADPVLVDASGPMASDADMEAALSCEAIYEQTEVCIGDSVCRSTDGHGNTKYRFMPPGGCSDHETEIETTTVDIACDAAKVLTADPECPEGCAGPITTTPEKTADCCTKRKTCYDPPPAPVEEEPVDEVPVDDG